MNHILSLEEHQASVPFVESSDFTKAFHSEKAPDVDSMSAEEITAELSRRGIDPEPSFKAVHAMLDAAIAAPDFGEPWEFAEWNAGVNRSPGYGLLSENADIQITVHTARPDGLSRDKDCTEEAKSRAARIVQCINATAGMQDPAAEIRAMRAAIVEAYHSIKNASTTIGTTPRQDQALAKLQPFLP